MPKNSVFLWHVEHAYTCVRRAVFDSVDPALQPAVLLALRTPTTAYLLLLTLTHCLFARLAACLAYSNYRLPAASYPYPLPFCPPCCLPCVPQIPLTCCILPAACYSYPLLFCPPCCFPCVPQLPLSCCFLPFPTVLFYLRCTKRVIVLLIVSLTAVLFINKRRL